MFERLAELEGKYIQLADQINDPDVIANQTKWRQLMKEYSDMTPLMEGYQEYQQLTATIEESLEMLAEKLDDEMRELVKEELSESKSRLVELEKEVTILLLPKDPNDDKNVIVEIRGGAGGDEAALFAGDLFRMYARYADARRWKTEIMNISESDLGGYKEVSFMITGKGAYSRLKYESGVHRVQRIPTTESGGRIHTSTVTVAVMPEAEALDVQIDMNDVRIDVFRASGNGGQCVNTTDSAVRMTHLPTGITVSCQNEKSQLKNKDQALKVLYARLYAREREAYDAAISAERKSQVGTGDRSERIRTYNFPQGRVTDHRIGLTLHKIESILGGDLDEVMNALVTTDQMEKMKASGFAE
ncbi:peptide chain release factor 1 [Chakrabartyella piscis]|uniref:peptide chain release factor 1 n=1 Tax=Chakrabartyella piscis TaxID=2918914 RepID=UPI002958C089|nr:peptide chain release factor 1 [Chakrabartyella piscis]